MRRRGRKLARGAAAVEFALLLPVLIMILLGTIDWGYYFFVEQVVTNAAREGARTGSLTPFTAGDPGPDATATTSAEAEVTSYLTAAGLDAARAIIAVAAGPSIQVAVSYPTGSVTGFVVLEKLMPVSASATAQMRR